MRAISLILIILSSGLFIQCDESENVKAQNDYYPLKENGSWEYLREFISSFDETTLLSSDTILNRIKGDTIIEGISYKKVVDELNTVVKVVRKQGGKYYGRNHDLYFNFLEEYLFLDEEALVNSSWRHYKNDSTTITEYKVIAVNSTRTIHGMEYKNAMELQVNYYYREGDEFKLDYSILHYYAKGVGEIYSFYPYGYLYCDWKVSLMQHNQ